MKRTIILAAILIIGVLLISSCKPAGRAIAQPDVTGRDLANFPGNIAGPELLGWANPLPVYIYADKDIYEDQAKLIAEEIEAKFCPAPDEGNGCDYEFESEFISQPTDRFIAIGTCDDLHIKALLDDSTCDDLVEGKALIQYVETSQLVVAGGTEADVTEAIYTLLAYLNGGVYLNGYYSDIINTENFLAASHITPTDEEVKYTAQFMFKEGTNVIISPLEMPYDKETVTAFFGANIDKINKIYLYDTDAGAYMGVYNLDTDVPSSIEKFAERDYVYVVDAKEDFDITVYGAEPPTASLAGYYNVPVDTKKVLGAFITGAAVNSITGGAVAGQTYATQPLYQCRRPNAYNIHDYYVSLVYPCPVGDTLGVLGRVYSYSEPQPADTSVLKYCYTGSSAQPNDDHFITINQCDPNTQDQADVPNLGYVYTTKPTDIDTVPLKRCRFEANGEHFQTLYECPPGDHDEGTWYILPFCSETDAGKDPTAEGTTTGLIEQYPKTEADACVGTTNVEEAYCDSGTLPHGVKEELIGCPTYHSCSDDACRLNPDLLGYISEAETENVYGTVSDIENPVCSVGTSALSETLFSFDDKNNENGIKWNICMRSDYAGETDTCEIESLENDEPWDTTCDPDDCTTGVSFDGFIKTSYSHPDTDYPVNRYTRVCMNGISGGKVISCSDLDKTRTCELNCPTSMATIGGEITDDVVDDDGDLIEYVHNKLCVSLTPSCENDIQDGQETGVDCGGPCDPCPPAPNMQIVVKETFLDNQGGNLDLVESPTCPTNNNKIGEIFEFHGRYNSYGRKWAFCVKPGITGQVNTCSINTYSEHGPWSQVCAPAACPSGMTALSELIRHGYYIAVTSDRYHYVNKYSRVCLSTDTINEGTVKSCSKAGTTETGECENPADLACPTGQDAIDVVIADPVYDAYAEQRGSHRHREFVYNRVCVDWKDIPEVITLTAPGEICTQTSNCQNGYECIESVCTRKIPIYQNQDQIITTTEGGQLVGYVLDPAIDNVPNTELAITCEEDFGEFSEYEGTAITCRSGTTQRETLGYIFENHQPAGTVKFNFPLLFAHDFYYYPEPYCGNGITEPPEECDDGNLDNGDGCDSNCQNETIGCGDGNVDAGEECDDGKTPDPTVDCSISEYDNWYGNCTQGACVTCECKGTLNCAQCIGTADWNTYCAPLGVTPLPPPPLIPPPVPPPTLPPFPHQFYGNVINGLVGMPIQATLASVNFNTIVDTNIQYGYSPIFLITGTTDGALISFYVNDSLDQTYAFQQGALTQLDLTYTAGGAPPTGPTCTDNVLNQDETDVDCGGTVCPKCAKNENCTKNSDCKTNYCKDGVCKTRPVPRISGGGGGGSRGKYVTAAQELYGMPQQAATACSDDWICDPWGPCLSGTQVRECFLNDYPECLIELPKPETTQSCVMPEPEYVPPAAPTCFDGIQNQDETFIDCGGSRCKPCDPNLPCATGRDCVTNYCDPIVQMCGYPPVVEIPKPPSLWWVWLIVALAAIGVIGGTITAVVLLRKKGEEPTNHRLKDLKSYVDKYKKKGVSTEKIRQKVLEHGWKKEAVDKVLK